MSLLRANERGSESGTGSKEEEEVSKVGEVGDNKERTREDVESSLLEGIVVRGEVSLGEGEGDGNEL